MENNGAIIGFVLAALAIIALISKKGQELYSELKEFRRKERAKDREEELIEKTEKLKFESKESTFWKDQWDKWHAEVKIELELEKCQKEHQECKERDRITNVKLDTALMKIGELEHLLGKVG